MNTNEETAQKAALPQGAEPFPMDDDPRWLVGPPTDEGYVGPFLYRYDDTKVSSRRWVRYEGDDGAYGRRWASYATYEAAQACAPTMDHFGMYFHPDCYRWMPCWKPTLVAKEAPEKPVKGGVLRWDKPKREQPVEEWKRTTFDCGPAGGYTPNMSREDVQTYRAKLVGHTKGRPEVEVRVQTKYGTNVLIKVNLQGVWEKVFYDPALGKANPEGRHREAQVAISANGPMEFTLDDWAVFQEAVNEGIAFLLEREETGEV